MLHNGQEKREVNDSNISTPGELKNVTLFVDKGITVVFKREQEKIKDQKSLSSHLQNGVISKSSDEYCSKQAAA